MNFQPPEEDDPRDDDQRMQDAEPAAPQGVAIDTLALLREAKSMLALATGPNSGNPGLWKRNVNDAAHRIAAALAQAGQAAPAGEGTNKQVPSLVRLRFFRDLTEEQRLLVFKVFGVLPGGAEKEAGTHYVQGLLLKRMYAALATPATEPAAPGYVSEVIRMRDAIDAIYSHNAAARAAVVQHYGTVHAPIIANLAAASTETKP